MRRKDRRMSEAFALDVLDRSAYITLSMITPGGEPYAVALSTVREGDRLFFHCAHQGKKIDCLRAHDRVHILAATDIDVPPDDFTTEYASAMARGTAREITDDTQKIHALRLLCLRHTPENMAAFDEAIHKSLRVTAVWAITLEEVTGKRKKLTPDGCDIRGDFEE